MYRILSKYKFSFLLRVERLIRLVCIYLKRLPHCSPKWLYHFTSLLAVNESSSSSTSLSIFDIVRLFNFKYFNTCVVILICISLMTNNAKHLCMSLFTFFIFSLMKYLFKSVAHFLRVLFLLLLNSQYSLYILD